MISLVPKGMDAVVVSFISVSNHTKQTLYGGMYCVSSKGATLFESSKYPDVSGVREIIDEQENRFLRPPHTLTERRYFAFSFDKNDLKKRLTKKEFDQLDSICVGITRHNQITIGKQNGKLTAELTFT